jgi:hypothetical protein
MRAGTRSLLAAASNARVIWLRRPVALSRHSQVRVVGVAADAAPALIQEWQLLADEQVAA